jgi:isopentenyl diphosphate isomerase/L-lactate dehydrogenase-like FMN-dependent dehydrogenase
MMDRWLPPSRRGSGYEYRAALTWETLDAIKAIAGLPFILKGVATAEDAVIAVEHGANTIYVSNHGGRQLDHGRATIDMLPEIVQAVGGGAQIIIDGGIVRGSDVLKAIALGATAVAIGKLQGWGAGGGRSARLSSGSRITRTRLLPAWHFSASPGSIN